MGSNSLSFRLLAITAGWMTVTLLVTGILFSAGVRKDAESKLENDLQIYYDGVLGALEVDENGEISGTPSLGKTQFFQPLSGWYWTVSLVSDPSQPVLHSTSISGDKLELASLEAVPFNDNSQRTYTVEDANGADIQRLEGQFQLTDEGPTYQLMVSGSLADVDKEVSDFNSDLWRYFLLLGVSSMAAPYFVSRFGLKPLDETREALFDVREGKAEKLSGNYPKEIQPLANEINALISANRSIVDRARTQVGNLAHGLKTPLAVIQNEIHKPSRNTKAIVGEQTELMKSQVQTYLDRARIAAQREVVNSRTNVSKVLERLVRVMNKLNPSIQFDLVEQRTGLEFKGEQQDLEEIVGNLLENAARFARSNVKIELSRSVKSGYEGFLQIEIHDDGPGLSEDQMQKALKRGIRLDETNPGSGLGLSIVRDIAVEYKGEFYLGKSDAGGLLATIILPRASIRGEERA